MIPVILSDGVIIAHDYARLVVGGRGSYLEIPDSAIVRSQVEMEPGQEYRLTPYWQTRAYYEWWRTKTTHAKLYKQLRTVTYADYKIGMWYIDPLLVIRQNWRTS